MDLLRELLRKYLRPGLVLLATTILLTLLGLLNIELGRRIIDVVSSPGPAAGRNYGLLIFYSALAAGGILGAVAINYLISILFTRMNQSVLGDIRLKLYDHILQLPQDFHNANPVGVIMSRMMNDIGHIGQFLSRFFLQPLVDIFMVLFFTVYIFYLNWKLAIAGIITIPVIVIILPRFNRRLAELSEEYSNSMGNMTSFFQETLSGISDIRSNQTYSYEDSRLRARIRDFFDINLRLARTSGVLNSLMRGLTQFGPLLVYLYGGILCFRGEVTVGTLVATIAVIRSLYNPVDSFVSFLQEWRQVKVRLDKLDEYLCLKQESQILPDGKPAVIHKGDIDFNNIHFGFKDREMLLKDINFRANAGSRTAFVGLSGSGKSLTAALINRIYRPSSGRITLGEIDLDSIPLHQLRSQIGYVNQVPFLFNDTIKKNILYSLLRKKGEDSDRLEEWIDLPGLENINQPEELDKKIINAVKDVGLFDDLYELGVQSKLMGDSDGTLADSKRKLLEARRRFLREIAKCGDQHVEFYRKEEFLEYCTVFENIVFSPSALIVQEFGSIKEFSRKYLNPLLKRTGLLERLFSMGIDLAREDIDLVESLYKKKSPLLSHLRMSTEQIKSKLRINEKIALQKEETIQMNQVDLSVVEDILDLAYNYVPGKSKENLLDDGLKRDILKQRYFFGENLPDAVKEKLKVFDSGAYMEVLSLRENIVFGNVNPSSRKANELINGLIRKIASEVGIEDLLLNLGLEFNVGERGSKLSGGQRQKVALARILLKEPSILILDEATANLDAASQARIVDLIGEKFNDKMVISIAHRLDTVKDYHEIVVFDKGQIVERGTFEELVNRDGLFRKLYSGSN